MTRISCGTVSAYCGFWLDRGMKCPSRGARRWCVAFGSFACVSLGSSLLALPAFGQQIPEQALHVDSVEALYAALEGTDPPPEIHLAHGEYGIDRPIVIPDGTSLVGRGVMRYDGSGTPMGFDAETATTLRITKAVPGDALTMGNGSAIRNLVIRDFATDAEASARRTGAAVVIASRAPGDVVDAAIVECEIENPNQFGFSDDGPTGHAVVIMARNPRAHLDPPPHGGAVLNARIERTIIRATHSGGAIFAINFAPRAATRLELTHNRIEGPLAVTAGVSRPDPVTEARIVVRSDHNRFGSTEGPPRPRGWVIIGGSSAPHHPHPDMAGARINSVDLRSSGDRIDGTVEGIRATGGRRFVSTSGPVSDNRVELDLRDLHIRTAAPENADLTLRAALAEPDPQIGTEFPVGDRNVVRVRMDGATGSGLRANVYELDSPGTSPARRGVGNRIEIVGTETEFRRRNEGFDPPPPSALFTGESGLTPEPSSARRP
jgi:hypothetical protein